MVRIGRTIIEILTLESSYASYRASFAVAGAVVGLATVDRLVPALGNPSTRAYRAIRLASRMFCLLPAHVWSLQALFRVAALESTVTTAELLRPADLAEALWTFVLSLTLIGLLQGGVFILSPSARAALSERGGLFVAGPVVCALGALLGYSWLALFHLAWWS